MGAEKFLKGSLLAAAAAIEVDAAEDLLWITAVTLKVALFNTVKKNAVVNYSILVLQKEGMEII